MKRLVTSFFFNSTIVLTAGAVGIVTGLERLLQNQRPNSTDENARMRSEDSARRPSPDVSHVGAESLKAEKHFTIKRTRSDVGYVYWILEGRGKYKCFVLCDSWDDAVAQAGARLAGGSGETTSDYEPSQEDMTLTIQG